MDRSSRAALTLTGLLTACAADGGAPPAGSRDAPPGPIDPTLWFTDQAAPTGLDFDHFNGLTGQFYQPEIMGPGAALFDYDNDGDLDVFLVQGQPLDTGTPVQPLPPEGELRDRLFRNDLTVRSDGTRTLRFTDVTAASGIAARGYGQGVATGDIDNDGWVDLYLTGFGRNQMFRNDGDGTFTDVTAETGTGTPDWSVSAGFADVDHDGWLDLFVGNYLRYTLDTHIPCFSASGPLDYCAPERHPPQRSRFYRNHGDGTFTEATAAAGMAEEFGPALGVSSADFDGDGRIDLFIATKRRQPHPHTFAAGVVKKRCPSSRSPPAHVTFEPSARRDESRTHSAGKGGNCARGMPGTTRSAFS